MSDTTDDFDFEDEEDAPTGDNLVKKLRAQLKKQAKELAALTEANEKAAKEVRTSGLRSLLKAKGVPIGLARLYEGDEVTDEAVTAWLHEVKDEFGLDLDDENTDTDEDDEAMSRLQSVASQAPKSKPRSAEDMIAHLQNASIEDLHKEGFFAGL